MSYYQKVKAVRYKLTDHDKEFFEVKDHWELRDKYPELLEHYGDDLNCWSTAPTVGHFLDFTLVDTDGEGDFGRARGLYPTELTKYAKSLEDLFKDVKSENPKYDGFKWRPHLMNFRLVEYSWYNCCEAPDYFDEEGDEFYDQV